MAEQTVTTTNTNQNDDSAPPDDVRAAWMLAHQKSSDAYDKAVMSLAGGALAISITFVHDIAPDPQRNEEWLTRSWFLFAASLGMIFVSFLSSQYAVGRRIREWDGRWVIPWDFWRWTTKVLNLASGVAFIVGMICLVRFAQFNI